MKENTHHALLFTGDKEASIQEARNHIERSLKITVEGNPDVEYIIRDRFSIADARTLKVRASQTPFGSAQVFIIVANSILVEAQNALLKLLEEPIPATHFYLLLPSTTQLLGTVQSRILHHGHIPERGYIQHNEFIKTFLTASFSERTKLIEPFIKEKDRVTLRELLFAFELYFKKEGLRSHTTALQEIAFAQSYLSDKSSSPKMILGHLVAVL